MAQNDQRLVYNDKECYTAYRARNPNYDGYFFVGVVNTGHYCRPVCKLRTPKAANCVFFPSAPAAEAAGYKPCLRCRPELAPGRGALTGPVSRLARQAALMMDEDVFTDDTISGLAEKLGITDRHLRRVFAAQYGVSPRQYLKTRRLLLAKHLLTDSRLPIIEVSLSSGFRGVRTFNEVFKKHYGLTPTQLRRLEGVWGLKDEVRLLLAFRPPYNWAGLRQHLAAELIKGVEELTDGGYRRTIELRRDGAVYRGWVSVSLIPGQNLMAVSLAPELLPLLPKLLTRIRLLFDIDSSPEEIYKGLSGLNELAPGACTPGTRAPGCCDPFELAVRAIFLTWRPAPEAAKLTERFARHFGERLRTPFPALDRLFPQPETILRTEAAAEMKSWGLENQEGQAIEALAEALVRGRLSLAPGRDRGEDAAHLKSLPGLTAWTVQYIGLRALGWPDAFPYPDPRPAENPAGPAPEAVLAAAPAWRPWRSYAVANLWNLRRGDGPEAE